MNTISENAGAWRPSIQLAAVADRPQDQAKPADAAGKKNDEFRLFSEDGFTFYDFLDIINPLQHIPIIGTVYRQLTDDQINPGARVLGDTLFFGPIGTVASIGDMFIREATGKDVGEHVVALFEDQTPGQATAAKDDATMVADAGPAAAGISPTQAVDPVTAWALGEAAYRNAIAAKAQTSRAAPAAVVASAPTPATVVETAATPAAFIASADDVREWAARTISTAPKINVSDGRTWASLTTPVSVPAPTPQKAAAKSETFVDAPVDTPSETPVWRDRNAAIRDATPTLRHSRMNGSLMTSANFGRLERPEGARDTAADKPAPFGAVAADGGWFGSVMMSAQDKYKNNAGQSRYAPTHTVDMMY